MNARIKSLVKSAMAGRPEIPVAIIAGHPGVGKTFTARVLARWAQMREAVAKRARCPICDNERIMKRGNGYGPCDCMRRKPFTVEHVRAFKLGDARNSLLTIFTNEGGFDERGDAARIRIGELIGCAVLIIDDLGSERNPPPTFEPALSSLVEQRTEAGKLTLIITNIGGNDLRDRYGARNYSRIVNAAEVIPMHGEDRRKRAA